tara:strand:- start:1208 stop:1546 length:339 start_codon:yes stop_codon:yes gene_type:complete
MNLISTFIIWIWFLGISFVVPTSLPAGGHQQSNILCREKNIGTPLIAFKDFDLLSSASNNSNVLIKVKAGTPVNVLKVWDGNDNEKWLLVNVLSQKFYQLFDKRGWINIGTS